MTSKIEWADETWPVVTGCSSISTGCCNCYAARMAATRLKYHPRYDGLAVMENGRPKWTGEVRLNPDVLEQPLKWHKPRRIFVASMGDLFHKDVPLEYIEQVFEIMYSSWTPETPHTYQILTKRPKRMLSFLKYYWCREVADFIWLGVSVENQAAADERIPLLLQTPAATRFVSCEPLLGKIDLTNMRLGAAEWGNALRQIQGISPAKIDWVIVGGESGPDARPMHPQWARDIRDQCQATGVSFFFKQMSKRGPIPEDLMIREYPK